MRRCPRCCHATGDTRISPWLPTPLPSVCRALSRVDQGAAAGEREIGRWMMAAAAARPALRPGAAHQGQPRAPRPLRALERPRRARRRADEAKQLVADKVPRCRACCRRSPGAATSSPSTATRSGTRCRATRCMPRCSRCGTRPGPWGCPERPPGRVRPRAAQGGGGQAAGGGDARARDHRVGHGV